MNNVDAGILMNLKKSEMYPMSNIFANVPKPIYWEPKIKTNKNIQE